MSGDAIESVQRLPLGDEVPEVEDTDSNVAAFHFDCGVIRVERKTKATETGKWRWQVSAIFLTDGVSSLSGLSSEPLLDDKSIMTVISAAVVTRWCVPRFIKRPMCSCITAAGQPCVAGQ